MELVKIENSSNLARDIASGAIINTNTTEYENYLARKKSSKDLKEQIQKNADEIKELKSDITEIKDLLVLLINKER